MAIELVDALAAVVAPPPVPVPITSDPTTVPDVDLANSRYIEITSSGSGGVEYVNIPNFPVGTEFTNPQVAGQFIVLTLKTQADPGDIVQVTIDGTGASLPTYEGNVDDSFPLKLTTADGIVLDYEGSYAVLRWIGDQWTIIVGYEDGNNDTEYQSSNVIMQPESDSSAGSAGAATIAGGSQGGAGNGGGVFIFGGQANGGGVGGDVSIAAGSGGSSGNVLVSGLPTADPHVADALWNSAGTLKISAG